VYKGDEIAKAGMRNENLMKETAGEKSIIVLHNDSHKRLVNINFGSKVKMIF